MIMERLSGGNITIAGAVLAHSCPVWDVTDFCPWLTRFVLTAVRFGAQDGKPLVFFHLADGLPKALGHVCIDRELNGPETFVNPFGTITKQLLLISGGIGTNLDFLNPLREVLQ